MGRIPVAALVGLLAFALQGEPPAHAQSSDAAPPRLPAAFLLPDLSHARLDVGIDWFVGSVRPEDHARPRSTVGVARPFFEVDLWRRRLYLGANYPVAWALPPDGGIAAGAAGIASGVQVLGGNIEAHVRTAFMLPTWLESGLSMGIVLPTATFDRHHAATLSAGLAAMTLDPTSYASFLPGRVVLRPAGDLRILRGQFVLQARQGLDVIIDDAGDFAVSVAGTILGHAGYLARPDLELSIEASQVYFFSSDTSVNGALTDDRSFAQTYRVSDDRRAAFSIGPAVRVVLRDFDLGVAFVTGAGRPLSPVANDFIGMRISVIGHAGAHAAP